MNAAATAAGWEEEEYECECAPDPPEVITDWARGTRLCRNCGMVCESGILDERAPVEHLHSGSLGAASAHASAAAAAALAATLVPHLIGGPSARADAREASNMPSTVFESGSRCQKPVSQSVNRCSRPSASIACTARLLDMAAALRLGQDISDMAVNMQAVFLSAKQRM